MGKQTDIITICLCTPNNLRRIRHRLVILYYRHYYNEIHVKIYLMAVEFFLIICRLYAFSYQINMFHNTV